MKANFKKALARVLVHEGGRVDDARDPGGRTNQGVIQRVYDDYRKSKGQVTRDVYSITDAERDEIYRRRYWDVIEADKLPSGVDYVVFDGAVNSGPSQSVKWVQRALGAAYQGRVDGQMGMTTLRAIEDYADHDALIAAICARRLDFLDNLKTWRTFGKGWSARVAGVKATGQAWARNTAAPPPEAIPDSAAKARIEDMKPLPVKATADAAAGAGGSLALISQAVDQSKSQLSAFSDVEIVNKGLLVLTVIGLVLLAAGIAYRWYAARKTKDRLDALDLNPAARREG